jgi:hypothetical protein
MRFQRLATGRRWNLLEQHRFAREAALKAAAKKCPLRVGGAADMKADPQSPAI